MKTETIHSLLTTGLVLFLLLLAPMVAIKFNFYPQYLDLLRVTIWPLVIFLALLFFRKVFFYLFLSIDEFNFFGTKGHLKNPIEIISEKIQEGIKNQQEQEKKEKERADMLKAIESGEASSKELVNMWLKLSEENSTLKKNLEQEKREKEAFATAIHSRAHRGTTVQDLTMQMDSLLRQVASLQTQLAEDQNKKQEK